jgi:hypothetical protein
LQQSSRQNWFINKSNIPARSGAFSAIQTLSTVLNITPSLVVKEEI